MITATFACKFATTIYWTVVCLKTNFQRPRTELVGVTVGEAQNPRKTVPRAIKLTFYRILFFYCLSVLLLGMLVPYVSPYQVTDR